MSFGNRWANTLFAIGVLIFMYAAFAQEAIKDAYLVALGGLVPLIVSFVFYIRALVKVGLKKNLVLLTVLSALLAIAFNSTCHLRKFGILCDFNRKKRDLLFLSQDNNVKEVRIFKGQVIQVNYFNVTEDASKINKRYFSKASDTYFLDSVLVLENISPVDFENIRRSMLNINSFLIKWTGNSFRVSMEDESSRNKSYVRYKSIGDPMNHFSSVPACISLDNGWFYVSEGKQRCNPLISGL